MNKEELRKKIACEVHLRHYGSVFNGVEPLDYACADRIMAILPAPLEELDEEKVVKGNNQKHKNIRCFRPVCPREH